eukprot:1160411-Pelagomonas_calceolata.AAC.8
MCCRVPMLDKFRDKFRGVRHGLPAMRVASLKDRSCMPLPSLGLLPSSPACKWQRRPCCLQIGYNRHHVRYNWQPCGCMDQAPVPMATTCLQQIRTAHSSQGALLSHCARHLTVL